MAVPAIIAALIAKEGLKAAIKKFGKKAVDKVKSSTGTNFKDAKTKTGEQSKGRIQNKDGDTSHLMGKGVIDVQNTTNVKVRFEVSIEDNNATTDGDNNVNKTYFTFIRLGDT